MTQYLGRTRTILAIVATLLGAVACFVPLFDIVGYESAALFGVLCGFAVSYLPPADRNAVSFLREIPRNLALLAGPFALLSLNALRVQNCDPWTGFRFWLFISVVSVVVAQTVAFAAHHVTPHRRFAVPLVTVFWLATIGEFAWRLATQPPIIGFHPLLGYFSGSIYDEALAVPDSLVHYRLIHLWLMAAVLARIESAHRTGATRRNLNIVAALCLAGWGWLFVNRQEAGIDLDRETIAETLGGVVESEHFVIHYPASVRFDDEEVSRMVDDHEFRYAEMMSYFGTDPVGLHGAKVRSFVYENRDQKGILMGARRTLVAKIWLREMHILWRFHGDHMLAHELAHVFTEPFGNGPLRLSSRAWVGVNMGLVEGVATAADWDSEDLDPHQASAALRRMDKAPRIETLVGASGFWTQSSGRAYTLMGSFVRWLVDEHGMEKFREAYPHGDFEQVYGVPPEELVAKWGAFVDGLELSDAVMERAKYRYDRKSIFDKVCARTVGELRVQANQAATRGDQRAAIEAYETILGFDPTAVGYRLEFARLLQRLERFSEAREQAQFVLDSDPDAVNRATATHLLGDLHWLEGNLAGARRNYASCLSVGIPVGTERLLRVKAEAAGRPPEVAGWARSYLLDSDARELGAYYPMRWATEHPEDPLAAYLLARRLWDVRAWDDATPLLRRAIDGLGPGVLRSEALRMQVQAHYFSGRHDLAEAELAAWHPTDPFYAGQKDEWARRVAWRNGRD